MKSFYIKSFIFFSLFLFAFFALAQTQNVLTEEEINFLKNKNNTLSVLLAKDDPIFSFQNPGGNIQGLSVDYLNLISSKLGIKIEYQDELSRNQIMYDLNIKRGDIALGFNENNTQYNAFLFTKNYTNVKSVILAREDLYKDSNLSLLNFKDKKIAVISGSSLYFYIKNNFPDVVLENTLNNQEVLQKIFLGEVDAGVMDATSFSYFMSSQPLSSLRIVGDTSFSYDMSFMLPKENIVLKSILDKGIDLVKEEEKKFLNDKWFSVAYDNSSVKESDEGGEDVYYLLIILSSLVFLSLLIIVFYKKVFSVKDKNFISFKKDLEEIKKTNQNLEKEIQEIKQDNFLKK